MVIADVTRVVCSEHNRYDIQSRCVLQAGFPDLRLGIGVASVGSHFPSALAVVYHYRVAPEQIAQLLWIGQIVVVVIVLVPADRDAVPDTADARQAVSSIQSEVRAKVVDRLALCKRIAQMRFQCVHGVPCVAVSLPADSKRAFHRHNPVAVGRKSAADRVGRAPGGHADGDFVLGAVGVHVADNLKPYSADRFEHIA